MNPPVKTRSLPRPSLSNFFALSGSLIVCLLISFQTRAQTLTDSVGVFIPRDEYSVMKGPQKFMWVDLKNVVISTMMGSAEFIEVWTDNGHADRPRYYSPDFCTVTPAYEGTVHVYTTQRIPLGNDWDTIYTVDKFVAVNQPEIRLMDQYDSLTTTGELQFFLADKYKFTELGERYKIAQPYEVLVFDHTYSLVGKIAIDRKQTIVFDSRRLGYDIKKGYKIAMQLLVRDVETDLLIPADEWVHIVE